MVQLRDEPAVWFNRDEFGHALLNVRMLTTLGNESERIAIRDNDFVVRGTPADFEAPPSGRWFRVRYGNGDYMRVEFRTLSDLSALCKVLPHFNRNDLANTLTRWPVNVVLITMTAGGTDVSFGPRRTRLPRNNNIRLIASHGEIGFWIR